MKVVVDTNILVSGAFWGGAPAEVLLKWMQQRFDLVVSKPIADEYRRVLLEVSAGRRDYIAEKWVLLVSMYARFVTPAQPVRAVRDPDDDKFLECALAGDAIYVVSGDKDLLAVVRYEGVRIVTARRFLSLLDSG